MGSGNHARTYLHRTPRGTLIELPLGWYADQGGHWAMNPGYDQATHEGFRRKVAYECMFCHNGYPRIPAGHERVGAEPVYLDPLPAGNRLPAVSRAGREACGRGADGGSDEGGDPGSDRESGAAEPGEARGGVHPVSPRDHQFSACRTPCRDMIVGLSGIGPVSR